MIMVIQYYYYFDYSTQIFTAAFQMKNNQTHSNPLSLQIIDDKQFYQYQKQVEIRCPFMKPSVMICMSKTCTINSFMCADFKCDCRMSHQKCLKTDTESFLENIRTKNQDVTKIQILVDDQIKKIIDSLSEFREKSISQLRTQFQYFGMSHYQRQLLKNIKRGNYEQMTGSKVWLIIQNQQQKQKQMIKQFIDKSLVQIQSNFQKSTAYIEQNLIRITSSIQECNESVEKYFDLQLMQSEIIKTRKQLKTIQNFFTAPNKIKFKKLLYRASENDFLVSKFHEQCDGILNTIVLIETDFGKKIGGYTPKAWNSQTGSHQDNLFESFIFSLTYEKKIEIKNKQNTVRHNNEYGPIFGGGTDLSICNKANQNANSLTNINYQYVNQNYNYKNKDSWLRFFGNSGSYNFKVKQWEVWSIEFLL